jgi:hypothetical protein
MFRYVASVILGLLALSSICRAQTLAYSPMGAIVVPGKSPYISRNLQSQLPKNAIARFEKKTHMNASGEDVVVYSLDENAMKSHMAIFRDDKLAKDFSLEDMADPKDPDGKEYMGYYVFFSFLEVPSPSSMVDVFSFHNYGDGAGTVLVAITSDGEKYKAAFFYEGSQSQIRLSPKAQTAELWTSVGDGDCVWCEQSFDVSKLQWKDGKLVTISKFTTRHKYSPSPMSNQPIRLIRK